MQVPGLSTFGWTVDPILKLSTLYSYFISSEEAQTFLYSGEIASLKYLIAEYGSSESDLERFVQEKLQTMLSRYFDIATVMTTITYPQGPNGSKFIINIDIEVEDKGKVYKLSKVVSGEDYILKELEKTNLAPH